MWGEEKTPGNYCEEKREGGGQQGTFEVARWGQQDDHSKQELARRCGHVFLIYLNDKTFLFLEVTMTSFVLCFSPSF